MSKNHTKIVNIQCTKGQPKPGVIITNKQLTNLFPKKTRELLDIQIINKQMIEKHPSGVLYKCIETQRQNPRTIFFGGDHYASFFTVLSSLAIYGNDFRLIWIDAHGDIHNKITSPSGNLHGMPVRFLLEHTIPNIPRLKPEQIMYIGIRDLERAEWNYIHRKKIHYIKAVDLIGDKYDTSLKKIQRFINGHSIHVSIDVDVLDPNIMPSTGTLAPGGIQMENLLKIYNILDTNGKIFSIDVMEYNPTIGSIQERKIAKNTIMSLMSILYNK
jgi:arginase